MALSTSQMARMDRLLDEALALDAEGRRRWLQRLSPEHQDLQAALKRSLLPKEADAAEADRLATLPKLDTGWVESVGGEIPPPRHSASRSRALSMMTERITREA